MSSAIAMRFLRDVATHELTIHRDDGVHRHLTFQRPGSWCMGFHVTTWPGFLCYSGDMGCFVFTRLPDMFEFFRRPADKLFDAIDYRYWAEKCVAQDKSDGIEGFDANAFREAVIRWRDEFAESNELDASARSALESEVRNSVLPHADDGEWSARNAAQEFTFGGRPVFVDFWEARCQRYSYRFEWCCHALPWAINLYDNAKEQACPARTTS